MSLYVDIEKCFKNFQLKVKFEADDEIISIFGESGCGKSLTLKCISGIETPDKGKIILNNNILFDSKNGINVAVCKRNTGYLFQNFALFPNMTVRKNIFTASKGNKKERNKKTSEIIKRFCLEELENLYPNNLSGGQQQRTAIARMIVSQPEIMMFDEPFSSLDDHIKWKLEQELIDIIKEFKKTVLFVSHNKNEVYHISNKIAVMNKGKIEAFDKKEEIFKNPNTLSTALLTGCQNISRAVKISDNSINAIDWNINLKLSEQVINDINFVGIYSNGFEILNNKSDINVIECKILKEIQDINSVIIIFSVQENNFVKLNCEISKNKWAELKEKDLLYLRFPSDKLIQMR